MCYEVEGKLCANNQNTWGRGSLGKLTFSNFISPSKIRKPNYIVKCCPDLKICAISISLLNLTSSLVIILFIHSVLSKSLFLSLWFSSHTFFLSLIITLQLSNFVSKYTERGHMLHIVHLPRYPEECKLRFRPMFLETKNHSLKWVLSEQRKISRENWYPYRISNHWILPYPWNTC